MSEAIIEAIITGIFTLVVTILLIAERSANKKRDRKQDEIAKKQEKNQAYNAINNCIRLEIESGEDDVNREHRKLNHLTAMKVNGEFLYGKPVNGELEEQRILTKKTETDFYKKKDALVKKQMQLLDDFINGNEIKKENYL